MCQSMEEKISVVCSEDAKEVRSGKNSELGDREGNSWRAWRENFGLYSQEGKGKAVRAFQSLPEQKSSTVRMDWRGWMGSWDADENKAGNLSLYHWIPTRAGHTGDDAWELSLPCLQPSPLLVVPLPPPRKEISEWVVPAIMAFEASPSTVAILTPLKDPHGERSVSKLCGLRGGPAWALFHEESCV